MSAPRCWPGCLAKIISGGRADNPADLGKIVVCNVLYGHSPHRPDGVAPTWKPFPEPWWQVTSLCGPISVIEGGSCLNPVIADVHLEPLPPLPAKATPRIAGADLPTRSTPHVLR